MKRIELKPAPLFVDIERKPSTAENPLNDRLYVQAWRDDHYVGSFEAYRDVDIEGDLRCLELSSGERGQIYSAVMSEWCDWQIPGTPPVTTETILDLFARLKKSLEDKGLVAGGEAAE
ncbi:MAG TPA: hypothetical protein VGK73_08860 [Polyangiaceae bacterium]